MLFALKVHTDGKYHPTWKDRPDGRYVRTSPAIQQIAADIFGAEVETIDVSNSAGLGSAMRAASAVGKIPLKEAGFILNSI